MKILTPINDNPIYSQLVFIVASKDKAYASDVAKDLKKTQATAQRQLIYLVKKRYIHLIDHPKQKGNIKLFSVDYEKIIEEFITILQDKIKDLEREVKRLKINLNEEYESKTYYNYDEIFDINKTDFTNRLKQNKYLESYFKEFFREIDALKDRGQTINQVFFYTILLGNLEYINMWEGKEKSLEYVFQILSPPPPFSFINSKKAKESNLKLIDKHLNKEQENIKKRIAMITLKDKELEDLSKLNRILNMARLFPSLIIARDKAENIIKTNVIKNHLTEEEIKTYGERIRKISFSKIRNTMQYPREDKKFN